MGAGAGTRIEKRGEGRVNPGTCKEMEDSEVEVDRKTRERGRRRRGNSSHGRTTESLSETTKSCGGPELSDRRLGTGPGRLTGGRRSARNPGRFVDATWKTGETWVEREKKLTQEQCAGSVDINPGYPNNKKEAYKGLEVQDNK